MSFSPFQDLENAIIYFELPIGDLVKGEDGNVRPAILTIEVTAYLYQAKDQNISDRVQLPGLNLNSFYLDGWCVSPSTIPKEVTAGSWHRCNFAGAEGHVYLLEPFNFPFGQSGIGAITEEATGTQLKVIFQSGRRPNVN
jgi:hypothetical protein